MSYTSIGPSRARSHAIRFASGLAGAAWLSTRRTA